MRTVAGLAANSSEPKRPAATISTSSTAATIWATRTSRPEPGRYRFGPRWLPIRVSASAATGTDAATATAPAITYSHSGTGNW